MNELVAAIKKAVAEGHSVVFKITPEYCTYTLLLKDGCGYGRGVKQEMAEADGLVGASQILADSILKTLAALPELEAKNKEHKKAVPTGEFAA